MKVLCIQASLAAFSAVLCGTALATPPKNVAVKSVEPAKQSTAVRQRFFSVKYAVPKGESHQGTSHRVTVRVLDEQKPRIVLDKQCNPGKTVSVNFKASGTPVRIQVYDNGKLMTNKLIDG